MYRFTASLLLILAGCAPPVSSTDGNHPSARNAVSAQKFDGRIFVHPAGDDTALGTAEHPLATLDRARDLARERRAAGHAGVIEVLLAGGTYRLKAPVTFGPDDSGVAADQKLVFRSTGDDAVVITGSQPAAKWKPGPDPLWIAEMPEVRKTDWYPRQLYINGERRKRARTPNDGFYSGMQTTDGKTIHFPPGQLQVWANPTDVELVSEVVWSSGRATFPDEQPADDTLRFVDAVLPFIDTPLTEMIYNGNTGQIPYYFENAREFLDEPGEWYLDRSTGELVYWPLPGEQMEQVVAELPMAESLLQIKGQRGKPVHNIEFRELALIDSNWPLVDGHFTPIQAGMGDPDKPSAGLPAAIELEYADNCQITDCRIVGHGAIGVSLGRGCHGDQIVGNQIAEIGATGISVGTTEAQPGDADDVTTDNLIANNWIHDCALDNPGCVGLWIGFAAETKISHNDISRLPYSGISAGWDWGRKNTASRANVIEFNHIHDVMRKLVDGGGVYTLGFQPESVLRGNRIHDITSCGVPGNNGIFFDEGSSGWHLEGNVIYNVPDGPIRHNLNEPEDHAWGENSLRALPTDAAFPTAAARDAGPTADYARRWNLCDADR